MCVKVVLVEGGGGLGRELQRVCCGSQAIFTFGKGSGWFVVYDIKGLLATLNLFLASNDREQEGKLLFTARTFQTNIIAYCGILFVFNLDENNLFKLQWQESTFKAKLKLRVQLYKEEKSA